MLCPSFLPERETVYRKLERGFFVTKFSVKRRPENKLLQLRRETMTLVWGRIPVHNSSNNNVQMSSQSAHESGIDIREIREIRASCNSSRDFLEWSSATTNAVNGLASSLQSPGSSLGPWNAVDAKKCFVVFYGQEFNLKTLSFATAFPEDCQLWTQGLRFLQEEASRPANLLDQERFFRKLFYQIDVCKEAGAAQAANAEIMVSLQDLKKVMQRLNHKISTSLLRDRFTRYDVDKRGEIGFDDYASLLKELIFDGAGYQEAYSKYTKDGQSIALTDFQKFLMEEQHDSEASSKESVRRRMIAYLQDHSRQVQEPCFRMHEFMDWLFSKENQLFDWKTNGRVHHDMTRPLSHYWISSSHNTYLTGDQISSASSCEAYVRCLRMGCRSVELDCWDGPDGPIIFHGHTFTSKIKFIDVVRTIKEHAFVASEYPLILSIEDHCSLPQQRKMASIFIDILGDNLLSEPIVEGKSDALPSPEDLKRKILLKHKKLPEDNSQSSASLSSQASVVSQISTASSTAMPFNESSSSLESQAAGGDISNAILNGILFIQDDNGDWRAHFCELTNQKLIFSEMPPQSDEDEDNDEDEDDENDNDAEDVPDTQSPKEEGDSAELHYAEPWFHARCERRDTAINLLLENASMGDGTFLVRKSQTFVGDYSLSFLKGNKVYHVPIKSRLRERGRMNYYLIDDAHFDSLYALITHYQSNPIKSALFSVTLTKGVPPPNTHQGKAWFHPNCRRLDSERMLGRVRKDGAFLVRPAETLANCFVLSFWAERAVAHARIKKEGRLVLLGSQEFESLVDLVAHYERHPVKKKIRLTTPVTTELIDSISPGSTPKYEENFQPSSDYMDPALFTPRIYVKALYNYSAQKTDELTLRSGDVVSNVRKDSSSWWRGDLRESKQMWFPANFVQEIDADECPDNAESEPNRSNLPNGSIDIMGCKVDLVSPASNASVEVVIRLTLPPERGGQRHELGAKNREEALQWVSKIRTTAQSAYNFEESNRRKERQLRIARELSDLVVYCKSVVFSLERCQRREERNATEMSSFPETKAEKLMLVSEENQRMFLWFHRVQLSRVYPKAQRVDSTNYNPMPVWTVGSQMAALNFQKGDKPMQINVAKFLQNGNCGYVLRPDYMFDDKFVPSDPKSIAAERALHITLRILGGRHLGRKNGRGFISPFVEVEVSGAEFDNCKYRTKTVSDNGLNPFWNETMNFVVRAPELAVMRFGVTDVDIFGDRQFVGQYSLPVSTMHKAGFRSVPLKNIHSEFLELSALLVHVQVVSAAGAERPASARADHKCLFRSGSLSSLDPLERQ